MKKFLSIFIIFIIGISFVGCGSKFEEIQAPEVTELLSDGGVELDYATYEVEDKNDNKTIKVTVSYNGEIMIVGKIVGIRNIIEQNFGSDYSKIDLTIIQEEPEFTSLNYLFENGKWDKEVQ